MSATFHGRALVVDALSVRFGGRSILHSFTPRPFAAGSLTALIGPNAAGKSTLLKAIAGLVRAEGGVRLGDVALDRLPLAKRAQLVRFVPQAYQTQARLTVFDLLLVARMCGGVGRPRARPGRGHLRDRSHRHRTHRRRHGRRAVRRPAAARGAGSSPHKAGAGAVARRADVRARSAQPARVFRIARRAADDGAVVIAALHDLNLAARHADRVLLMGEGAIVADGPPQAVLTTAHCGPTYGVSLAHGRTSRGSLAIEAFLA